MDEKVGNEKPHMAKKQKESGLNAEAIDASGMLYVGYITLFNKIEEERKEKDNHEKCYSFVYPHELSRLLEQMIDSLTDAEKDVIKKFYGLGHKQHSLGMIGKERNCSREWVRQIYNNGIRKLCAPSRYQLLRTDKIARHQVADLELSKRAYTCVNKAGIKTVDEFVFAVKNNPERIKKVRGCGVGVMQELIKKVAEVDRLLNEKTPIWQKEEQRNDLYVGGR